MTEICFQNPADAGTQMFLSALAEVRPFVLAPASNVDLERKVSINISPNIFDEAFELQQHMLLGRVKSKGTEYTDDTAVNRLHNFYRQADIRNVVGISDAIIGNATKHIASVLDIVDGKAYTLDVLNEKCGDMIVYTHILWTYLAALLVANEELPKE